MAELKKLFAQNLKKKRRICGFTQANLAEKVDVSTHHIAMIELARNFPTSELIERIASALETEVYELFLEEKKTQQTELEKLRKDIKEDIHELFGIYLNR